MTYRIAFFADSHIGWRAPVRNNAKGINVRVQDGYDALRETVSQIINFPKKIDAVAHGGDLTHSSLPSIRDIATIQHYLRLLAKEGIPSYFLAGNHDATDEVAGLASVAAFHDPDRGIHALWEPYRKYELTDGIILHAVSHHGLHAKEAPQVQASSDVINIFTTHGAALDPKNQALLRCADSVREQIIPIDLVMDDVFQARLLGHYHSRYAVGNESLNTWYSGSALRRGFSDEPGKRGWLLVEVEPNGKITVTPQDISQRPQYDLKVIDAADLSPEEVMDLLEIQLGTTQQASLSPIVRQRITNASRGIREGLDYKHIKELSEHMLSWQLEFPKPLQTKKEVVKEEANATLARGQKIDISQNFKAWAKESANSVPPEYRDIVIKDAEHFLANAQTSQLGGHSH